MLGCISPYFFGKNRLIETFARSILDLNPINLVIPAQAGIQTGFMVSRDGTSQDKFLLAL